MGYKLESFMLTNLDMLTIPPDTKEFNLSNLRLSPVSGGHVPPELFVKILKKSPKKVEAIKLSQNDLGGYYDGRRPFSTDDLITILNGLPRDLVNLDLSYNYLHWLPADDLVRVIKVLPPQLESLNLASNALENYSASDLIKILKALPQGLKSLNLDWIKLHEKFSAAEVVEVLKVLPENLISLSFRGNYLGNYTHEEQIQIISSFPKQLKHLDLGNAIGRTTGANLNELFAVLPKGLVSLDWSENGLNSLSLTELQDAFSCLCTRHLTSLCLSANLLDDSQMVSLLPFLAHSKITRLELKSTFTQNYNGYKGLSKETRDQIEKILWNNQKKSFIDPDPMNEQIIYGLQALCAKAITLFAIPNSAKNPTKPALDMLEDSKRLFERVGLKVGPY
ncbi:MULTISPECIES: hypothetical protein [Legionella]|uniref:Leucine-rich repeat-containing protein n=1 Tax=Legionella maceachernii TaxID=466 RepID=A0A0W0VWJ2_9GAMM|nr:hypothetical protein [Legionella maceachernii]KTD24479.1 leucine-rich repeat-containing protein [Legionella maceachernii]SJZ60074.1 hypothetical protein SAMN02745128_00548 [Legionella maceachernii]SUP00817.1 Ran GTPase-activating protein (RanGAP) involved in mRNA processing and transport [Legionella maceachernii]